ncbi:MAG: hypothetical protein JSU63_06770 [Phycisphaerales bacterium]|nr:MAG: hypothetical protein JSU63_06770 [Phycisphaerales bacterium]
MSKTETFPARTVVTSFLSCEETLLSVLRIVPWCAAHENVWSPVLTTVIMESCSQLDSLWRHTAWLSPCVREKKKRKDDLNMRDYFRYFAGKSLTPLGKRWVVLWGGEDPVQICPYNAWDGADTYKALPWWQAYNNLKHDRLANRESATLRAAVNATAGLFLAILQSDHCRYAVAASDLLSSSDAVAHNPLALLGEDSLSVKDGYVLAESRLFSYPVGWCAADIKAADVWRGNASMRFKHWFFGHSTE